MVLENSGVLGGGKEHTHWSNITPDHRTNLKTKHNTSARSLIMEEVKTWTNKCIYVFAYVKLQKYLFNI